jgi:hypothetical protein
VVDAVEQEVQLALMEQREELVGNGQPGESLHQQ